MVNSLSLSNVINVSLLTTPVGLGIPNINTAALFSQEVPDVSFGTDAYKIYLTASEVLTDFGSDSDAFAIALSFFAQNPNPLTTGGYLVIVPRLQSPSLEAVEDAIVRTLDLIFYFGVLVDEDYSGDDLTLYALADYVQTLDKILFYCSGDVAGFVPNGQLDQIRQKTDTHTRTMYYLNAGIGENDIQQMAAAYGSRLLSVDFAGVNTASTMHLKTLSTLTPIPTLTQTQLAACGVAGADVYATIGGMPRVFTSGKNSYADFIYCSLAFKFALQVAGFNYLSQTNTKIPQTENGMDGLKNAYRKVCAQFVRNGFLAPGAWNSADTFGDQESLIRNVKDIGYYIYSLPVSQQAQADREDRKAPLIQIACKTAGAIHSTNVQVNVNI